MLTSVTESAGTRPPGVRSLSRAPGTRCAALDPVVSRLFVPRFRTVSSRSGASYKPAQSTHTPALCECAEQVLGRRAALSGLVVKEDHGALDRQALGSAGQLLPRP